MLNIAAKNRLDDSDIFEKFGLSKVQIKFYAIIPSFCVLLTGAVYRNWTITWKDYIIETVHAEYDFDRALRSWHYGALRTLYRGVSSHIENR